MMKVSEALRRATEERNQPTRQTTEEQDHRFEEIKRNNPPVESSSRPPDILPESLLVREHRVGATKDGNSRAETNGGSPLIRLPESCSAPKRRLSEKLEELLFGRDLRSLKDYPLVALEKNSAAAEQYKILREQLTKICIERNTRVLMVTSPIKGDGKTTVAANLAAAMALDYEEQVLLIDADLRDPSIHPYFGIKGALGLSDFLDSMSETSLMSYVQDTLLPGLRVLPGGKPSTHSSELLATDKMKTLLKEIPLECRIIVDTSPVLSTPDPLVLSRHADGIVMVIRAGKTPRDCVTKAINSLGSNNLIGVILNGAELGVASKYYYTAGP